MKIGGVVVEAFVDTGSQTTIISRSMLHSIVQHAKSCGSPLPVLEPPTVRLFGKDGRSGGQELVVTAQLQTTVEADGKSTVVPVFVQPESEQQCLLGMNVLPALGLTIRRANGEPVVTNEGADPVVAHVRLIQASTVPSLKGRFLKVKVDRTLPECSGESKPPILFEPDSDTLESRGLSTQESLVTVDEDGCAWVPVQNCEGVCAHLEKGMEVGTARYVKTVVESVCDSESGVKSGEVCGIVGSVGVDQSFGKVGLGCDHVGESVQPPERIEQLIRTLELPLAKLTEEQSKQLRELVVEYSDVFALTDSELGCTGLVQHVIDTGDHPPVKQQPYRAPVVYRDKITQMVTDMEKQNVIRPSVSPWASPVVLVPKKNGDLRFCVDYRRLNSVTRKDVYPIPRIDDILDTLGRVNYFTSLDLASGYWQVELEEGSRSKSAFTTHRGLYEFTRMSFGLCNAPATFQRLMQRVLAGLEWDSCFVYLDDILIASSTFEEHLRHLREVFERLRQAHLRLKPKKCLLLREEVPYLGHIVSSAGIKPDPGKIEQVRGYPIPTDATKVRQFLGLASYYRRFIPEFARIAHPMHALTRKDRVFEWTADCDAAFNKLKELLITAPVLLHPRFGPSEEFVLETDASGVGLGAILSQKHDGQLHPIAYASRSLDTHERNYAITELETLVSCGL